MLAVVEAHEVGSRMYILPCPLARPPVAALSIQRAIAGDGHVLGVFGVDARLMRQSCDALELQVNQREGGCVLMEAQHRAGLDVQRHVIVQADCARGVVARGDNQRAAAAGAEVSNGLLEGGCPVGGGWGRWQRSRECSLVFLRCLLLFFYYNGLFCCFWLISPNHAVISPYTAHTRRGRWQARCRCPFWSAGRRRHQNWSGALRR